MAETGWLKAMVETSEATLVVLRCRECGNAYAAHDVGTVQLALSIRGAIVCARSRGDVVSYEHAPVEVRPCDHEEEPDDG